MSALATVPTREQVAAVVREFLGQELKIAPSDIADDAVLKELPGADSVRLVRVVSRLERHWDREFDDDQVFDLRKLDDLVTLTLTYLNDADG
jgi:acyl carrier protein